MRILHVASFRGNIGDNLSHIGFKNILKMCGGEYSVTQLEMRRFYKNYSGCDKMNFDRSFVNKMNEYDIVFFGGGGFFDFWVEGSASGTTVDMEAELVAEITVPTVFSSIGCHPHRQVPLGNEEKFKRFFLSLMANENILIGLRNDGSVKVLDSLFDKDITACGRVHEILDNGFFYTGSEDETDSIKKVFPMPYVAINITDDQLSMVSNRRGEINKECYLSSLVKYVSSISEKYHVVFIPHIYSDLKAIYSILERLDQSVVRNKISVSPCVQGDAGTKFNFSIYANSQLVIASRFHANVGPLALGAKVIGLAVLDRVSYMYGSIGKADQYVDVSTEFSDTLLEKSLKLIDQHSCGELDSLNEQMENSIAFYKKALRLRSMKCG